MDCRAMRIDILKMGLAAKYQGAHLGGSLSLVEIMAALYGNVMNIDPHNLMAEERDRLILSKGHGIMAQYAALKQLGLLSGDQLLAYKSNGSTVSAHPTVNMEFGIEYASGSLGMGLSFAVGAAIALKRKKNNKSRVVAILGDGECDEGSVWEAAFAAAHYRLNNVIAIVDRNGLQYDGPTEGIMALGDFEKKWKAFGWGAVSVDGHDVSALSAALSRRSKFPMVVIARTVKGKGVPFMEHIAQWHNGVVTQKIFDQALAALEGDAC